MPLRFPTRSSFPNHQIVDLERQFLEVPILRCHEPMIELEPSALTIALEFLPEPMALGRG